MTAVRTLAVSILVWAAMGTSPAHADPISQAEGDRLWNFIWANTAVNSYQAPIATTSNVNTASAPAPGSLSLLPAVTAPAPMTVGPDGSGVMATAPAPSSSSGATPASSVDAFINMTSGPFPELGTLTTGTPQPWYNSPAVVQAFGSVPNAQQQASFTQAVLQDIQHTFQLSGMNPTLTTNPNVPALHTLSVVSGVSDPSNPNAIGLTDVGANGFSYIDKLNYATNPTDLAWAVAHNIAHELMHAFGVGYHPDGGNYVDAGTASWSTLTDPNAQFGPAATQLLLASQYGTLSTGSGSGIGAELLNPQGTKIDGDEVLPQPVPEPGTVALWALGALGGLVVLRRRLDHRAA